MWVTVFYYTNLKGSKFYSQAEYFFTRREAEKRYKQVKAFSVLTPFIAKLDKSFHNFKRCLLKETKTSLIKSRSKGGR